MIDGIYHVRFSASNRTVGEGLITVKNESVNGGDHGYLYLGRLASAGGQISGRLHVKRWNSAVASVFGPMQAFDLDLSGNQAADKSLNASGHIAGQPNQRISVAGRFLSEIA